MANRGGGGKSGDLYAVLGLKKECSEAELRNAYKKLAMVIRLLRFRSQIGETHR